MRGFRTFLPTVLLFLILNGLFLSLQKIWVGWGFSMQVLVIGNLFLFGLSLVSLLLHQRALGSASSQVFVRYFYISLLVKLVLVAVVALIYVKVASGVNRISVIGCMLIYLIYTFIELGILLKAGKQKNA
ncbi:MAG: hypothetical protein M9933_00905 [Chitinophagaceae bacterium]|nr:hypothetical protein [Chitinophagaceae bacterium]